MGADTAAELLSEGERLVSEIDAVIGDAPVLPLYLRLQDTVERAESALSEERP